MIRTLSWFDFCDAFSSSDTYKDNFSYEGKKALFEYLEQYEEETGEQIELDIVALCCDYSEFDSADEAASEHFIYEGMTYDPEDGGELKTVEQVETEARAFLEDNTTVLDCENGHVIIQSF